MVLRAGLEPAAHGLENRCSIHLSYRSISGCEGWDRTSDQVINSHLLYR